MGSIPLEQRIENNRRVVKGILTAREYEVLVLVAEGYTNREIADQVGLSPSTVHEEVSRVTERLGADSRVQCVHRAYERGLLGPAAAGKPPKPGGATFRRVGMVYRAVDPPLV